MGKYQVTINLVVEVEADDEEQACYNAKQAIDYYVDEACEVVEDGVLDVVTIDEEVE